MSAGHAAAWSDFAEGCQHIPRLVESRHRIVAGGAITTALGAGIAAIITIDGPTPCCAARCRRTRHAVEDAADLDSITEHDEVVRRFVVGSGLTIRGIGRAPVSFTSEVAADNLQENIARRAAGSSYLLAGLAAHI